MLNPNQVAKIFSNQEVKELASRCKIKLDGERLIEFAQYLRDAVEIHLHEYFDDQWLFATKGAHGQVARLAKAARLQQALQCKADIRGLSPFMLRQLNLRAERLGLDFPTPNDFSTETDAARSFEILLKVSVVGRAFDSKSGVPSVVTYSPRPNRNASRREAAYLLGGMLTVVWNTHAPEPAPRSVNRSTWVAFKIFVEFCLSAIGYRDVSATEVINWNGKNNQAAFGG